MHWQSVEELEEDKRSSAKFEKSQRRIEHVRRWEKLRAQRTPIALSSLGIIEPQAVRSAKQSEEWEELEMAVDSGASETVLPEEDLPSIELKEGEAKRKGVQYEVADGTLIPNLGEKSFVAVSEEGSLRKMRVQVCDVNKALLSVRRVTQAGNRVVFEQDGGWIEDKRTGQRMWMKEKDGQYLLKLWVRRSGEIPEAGFTRQGQ